MGLKELFIHNLKRTRKSRGISQAALAELCDSSTSYIGQIEIGNRFPSIEMIEKMARALKVRPHLFFFDESAGESGEVQPETAYAIPEEVKTELVRRLTVAVRRIVQKA